MYFWQIAKVREQLASGVLNERTGFKYFMAHVVFYSLAYLILGEGGGERVDYIIAMLSIPITIGGVLYAHHCNSGYEGENFYTRLFAISWVMTIKLLAAGVVFFFLLSLFEGAAENVDASSYLYTEAGVFILFQLIYYWRIGHHMRRTNDLAAAADGMDRATPAEQA